jgi:hypothetical protein
MKMTLRFLSKSFLLAAVGAMALTSQAWSQTAGFRAVGIHGGAEPNNAANNIIVYNLPASGSIYAGPASGSFNVLAQVTGGPVQVAGYGVIMTLPNGGPVNFNITALPASGTPNNIPNSTVSQNLLLDDIILGDTAVPGQTGPSLGVVGLHGVANANVNVANGDGLFNVPFQVAGGATGSFTLGMALGGNDFSGFAQSNGTVLTNPNGFPNANQTIIVRNSRRGDMNGDGNTNSADIGGFISVLNNGVTAYSNQFPWLQVRYISDFDQSNATNSADIGGFIAALNGAPSPGPTAVPEPSTLAMMCVGGALIGVASLRRRNGRKNA